MAFCDYEHCAACVDESEQRNEARRRGETLPDNLPDLVGYKGIYVGSDEVKAGVNVICDRHLDTLRSDLARVTAERDALKAEVEAMRGVCEEADRVYTTCEPTIPMVMQHLGECLDALRTRKVGE